MRLRSPVRGPGLWLLAPEARPGPAVLLDKAGLQEGDVIVAVANTSVSDVKEFEAAVARLDKSKPVSLLFRRGDWAQYALIRPAR